MILDEDRARLLDWYRAHARPLPWRSVRDPYAIWVSEAMLQQTQVATAIPHFERWMARFPTVERLAGATEEEALSIWQGLGYYRRCRQLLEGARMVKARGMPRTEEEWRAIPGVGPYTAGAIASIAYGEAAAVVDGNVERVFARIAGSRESGNDLRRSAWAWARSVIDAEAPGDWNQALMELGATVCTPANPKCGGCPLEARCSARQSWTVHELPLPRKRAPVERRLHLVFAPFCDGKFGVRKIGRGQWWEGLWEFPRADATDEPESAESVLRELVGPGWVESIGEFRHSVTHHRITLRASIVRCDAQASGLTWATPEELAKLAMPAPQRKVLARAVRLLGDA